MPASPSGSSDRGLTPHARAAAPALAARWYRDPAIVALERAAVFDRGWHLLAHASRLREPGDHVVVDCAGLPVIAVRDGDGAIRAFHNVCRHRAGPLAWCDGRGAKALRCRYHGWTYGLDGRLRSAPEMEDAGGFDPDRIRLPALAVREWRGLVFAAADATRAMPFDALVAGIDARLGDGHPVETYSGHHHAAYEIACNWKVYVDNYLEGYHVPHVHPALNRMLDYRSYRTELAEWHSLQWSPLESGEGLYGSGDALYYWLWPNTMLNLLPGRLQTNRVVPIGVDRCRVEFDAYYREGAAGDARRDADIAFSDEVQREDVAICEAVQRGLASGSYDAGPLNPRRESGVAHFHALLRTAYGEEQN
jgi:choline monooxygenase